MINSKEIKEIIKMYLADYSYDVLHEEDKNKEYEICFSLIKKDSISNPLIYEFFKLYEEDFPVKDFSNKTLKYLKNYHDYFLIFIKKIEKNQIFFYQDLEYVQLSAGNIISLNVFNETADITDEVTNKAKKIFSQFKEVSKGVKEIIGEEISKKVKTKK